MNNKQKKFLSEYLISFNATRAALAAGYSERTAYSYGQQLLKNIEIKQAIDEHIMSADEAAANITEIAHADMGSFFRLVEEWTFYPLPSYEILGEKEVKVLDEDGEETGEKKISYWVRHVVLDMDKLLDPKYSRLVHKFTDSPKNGLGIELYNKHDASRDILKYRGKMVDRTETLNIDLNSLTDDQLEKLKNGESLTNVLKRSST